MDSALFTKVSDATISFDFTYSSPVHSAIFTARIRSMGEGNVFSLSVHRGPPYSQVGGPPPPSPQSKVQGPQVKFGEYPRAPPKFRGTSGGHLSQVQGSTPPSSGAPLGQGQPPPPPPKLKSGGPLVQKGGGAGGKPLAVKMVF